jgi:hypothetical protein
MGALSRNYSGWGIGLFDFDNDGLKDIFTANSHVNDRVEAFEAAEYKQHNSVFRNLGDGRFEDVSQGAGTAFLGAVRAHRGCAFADFNKDGRIDVVTTSLGDRPEIWENVSPGGNTWLILKLRGTKSNRDGIGAVVRIGDQTNHMTTSVGYASSIFRVHFGVGHGRKSGIKTVAERFPPGTAKCEDEPGAAGSRTGQIRSCSVRRAQAPIIVKSLIARVPMRHLISRKADECCVLNSEIALSSKGLPPQLCSL